MDQSLCEYFYSPDGAEGHKCGYCKSKDTSISQGMWTHKLTCEDYQALVNRGWRRSGKYCYKPTMDNTCCPQYCIQCDVTQFRLSHSQKSVLKKMNEFVVHGRKSKDTQGAGDTSVRSSSDKADGKQKEERQSHAHSKVVCSGDGADPTKAPCRKAKMVRKEHRQAKAATRKVEVEQANSSFDPPQHGGQATSKPSTLPDSVEKTSNPHSLSMFQVGPDGKKPIEMFLSPPETTLRDQSSSSASSLSHKLEVRLIQSSPPSPEFKATFKMSYELFRKYQMAVHKEKEDDCTEKSFKRFLCDSPLVHTSGPTGWPCGYGSYHQHYLLDGQLIAVGVIDFLPNCISSVYVFYDVDYNFLSLGVYSALREVAMARSLHVHDPERFKYYYMGFYVHSCQKMRYKGQYTPSYLLCPESYKFVSIDLCRPKLDTKKYSRLYDGVSEVEKPEEWLGSLSVLYQHALMPYSFVKSFVGDEFEVKVREWVSLVGPQVAKRMILVL